ncbi:hypothetical protein MVEN_01979400 [Mycena venus]|uniref:Uncharacterized protein n=1 Tax=Mycena venus TaxID=2733690 RepID=A0A8H6XDC9_9AGAR|nr:hypothetical protein MVEN_01979400 [Mycena venus]
MPFHAGFVPVVLVCAAIGFKLYSLALVEPPVGPLIEEYLQSCTYSKTNPFHDFICVIEPFFQELVSNDMGKSFLTAFGTSGAVMSTYLYTRGGEGGGSLLFHPLIVIAQSLAGQVLGAGIIGPILLPLLSALSYSVSSKSSQARLITPPSSTYTMTQLTTQFLVFLISMALNAVPPTNPAWVYVNYAFQGFPLLFLPLAFFPRNNDNSTNAGSDVQKNNKRAAKTPTLTITAFTIFKYLYAPLWWISVFQFLRASGFLSTSTSHPAPFTPPVYFMVLDFAGFVLAFLGLYAVDLVADAGEFVAGEGKAGEEVVRRQLTAPQTFVLKLVVLGPASTMAGYWAERQRGIVRRAEMVRKQKE